MTDEPTPIPIPDEAPDITLEEPPRSWYRTLLGNKWKKLAWGIGVPAVLIWGIRDIGKFAGYVASEGAKIAVVGIDDYSKDSKDSENAAEKKPAAEPTPSKLETELDTEPEKLTPWTIKTKSGYEVYTLQVPDTEEASRKIRVYRDICKSIPNFKLDEATAHALLGDTTDRKLDGIATIQGIDAMIAAANDLRKARINPYTARSH